VWIVHADNGSGVGATLQAYQAVPQGGVLPMLWSAPLGNPGTGAKFNPPAVDNGRVYVGTRDGTVVGFGARPGAPALHANLVNFAPTSLGASSIATATFTATATITVTGLSVQNATQAQTPVFAKGTSTPATPVTLNAGQQLTVPMTFTPAALGLQSGTLIANTSGGAVSLPPRR
jgi:outer membrane protein assembly factor BamB